MTLVLGDEQRAMIRALVARAGAREPFNMLKVHELVQTKAGRVQHLHNMRLLSTDLGGGYTLALSIEDHYSRLFRHMSMAVDERHKLPSQADVEMVLPLLGFVGHLMSDNQYWREKIAANFYAINVIQPVDHVPIVANASASER